MYRKDNSQIRAQEQFAVPFYVHFWTGSVLGGRVRIRYLLFVVLALLSAPANWAFGVEKFIPYSYLYALLMLFEAWHALWSVNHVYAETLIVISSVDEHTVVREDLVRAFNYTYSSTRLLACCVGFSTFCAVLSLQFGLRVPIGIGIYFGIWIVIVSFVIAFGLWEGFASIMLFRAMLPKDDRAFYAVAPGRSAAIQRLSRLFLTYSIVYSVQTVPAALGIALFSHSTKTLSDAGYLEPSAGALLLAAIVVLSLVTFAILYFIIPQWMISRRVGSAKRSFLNDYQKRINLILAKVGNEPLMDGEAKAFEILRSVEQELHGTRTFPLSFMDITKSTIPILASIGTILSGHDLMKTAETIFRSIFPWLAS